jgi:hypothetical protein
MAYSLIHKHICKFCNNEYLGKLYQKYCSPVCRWKANRQNNYIATRQERSCKRCGKPFITKHLAQDYCSPACRLNIVGRTRTQVCPICKLEFQTTSKLNIYCSKKCKCRNKQRGHTKNRVLINKVGKCEVCDNNLLICLEGHHYTSKDKIVLCGNCHNIWHHLSKTKYSDRATVITTITSALLRHQEQVNSIRQVVLK